MYFWDKVWGVMSARESGIFLFCLMCCCLHPLVCCDIFHLTSQITPDNTTPSLDSGLATELLWGLFKTRNHDRPPLQLTAGGGNVRKTSYYGPDSKMADWNHQRSGVVMFINIKFWYGVEPTRKWWSCNLSWYNCDDNQTVYWYWVNFYLPGQPGQGWWLPTSTLHAINNIYSPDWWRVSFSPLVIISLLMSPHSTTAPRNPPLLHFVDCRMQDCSSLQPGSLLLLLL